MQQMKDEIKNQRREVTAMSKEKRKVLVGNNTRQYIMDGVQSVVNNDDEDEYADENEDEVLETAMKNIDMKNDDDNVGDD